MIYKAIKAGVERSYVMYSLFGTSQETQNTECVLNWATYKAVWNYLEANMQPGDVLEEFSMTRWLSYDKVHEEIKRTVPKVQSPGLVIQEVEKTE